MTRYCTLARAKQEIKAQKTFDDTTVFNIIHGVSKRIDHVLAAPEKRKRPYFAPYIETRPFRVSGHRVDSYNQTFDLYRNLLELTTVVTNGQDVTTNIQVYMSGYPPYTKLQLSNTNYTWYTLDTNPPEGRNQPEPLLITGIWGYHDDYNNAWIATDTLQAAIANTTDTTIKVNNADNFSAGHLIKINSEYMEVTDTNTSTTPDELTVTRGVNGSTAATHNNSTTVDIWDISEDIQRITARQVGQFYERRGAYDVSQFTQTVITQYPRDLNVELLNTLDDYRSNA